MKGFCLKFQIFFFLEHFYHLGPVFEWETPYVTFRREKRDLVPERKPLNFHILLLISDVVQHNEAFTSVRLVLIDNN